MESGLWGFCDGDTLEGSSCQLFGYETMHVEDLGVFLYIVDNVGKCCLALPDVDLGVFLYIVDNVGKCQAALVIGRREAP